MLLYIKGFLQLKSPLTYFLIEKTKNQKNHITIEHCFSMKVFFVTIDKQLQESNNMFNDQAIYLLTLSSALIPKNANKTFDIVRCVFENARKQFFLFNKSCFEIISYV